MVKLKRNKKSECLIILVKPNNGLSAEKLCVVQKDGEVPALSVLFSDNSDWLIPIGPQYGEMDSFFSQYLKDDKQSEEPFFQFTGLGGNWFTSDVYSLVKWMTVESDPNTITKMVVSNKSISPATFSQSDNIRRLLEPNIVGGKEKNGPKTVGRQNDNRSSSQSNVPLQVQDQNRNNAASDEALREIANILQNQFGIQMKTQNNGSDVLLEAIKSGLQQLLEAKDKPVVQENNTDNEALLADLKKQLDAKEQELGEKVKMIQDKDVEIQLLNDQVKEQDETGKKAKEGAEELQKQVSRLKEEVSRLESSTYDAKGELLKAVDQLKADLQEGNYIFDASGVSQVNPQWEKQAENLKNQIEAVNAEDVVQFRKAFKELLKKELLGKDSLFSQLARYYAYSRLPFMIESQGVETTLVPLRLASLYNKVVAILAPYGFQQIIPQLFVETVADGNGNYQDLTGNTEYRSILANMCPMLDRHKEMVDRNEKAKVIKDIVKVGFTEDGKLTETTSIIV